MAIFVFVKTKVMEKKNHSNKNIGRREFLKRFRSAAAVVGATSLAGCVSDKEASRLIAFNNAVEVKANAEKAEAKPANAKKK